MGGPSTSREVTPTSTQSYRWSPILPTSPTGSVGSGSIAGVSLGRRDYRASARVAHPLNLQPDGSFRIDEVQSGDYEIHIRVPEHAELIRRFIVTAPAADQDGGPVDLGTLTLERSGSPDAGR